MVGLHPMVITQIAADSRPMTRIEIKGDCNIIKGIPEQKRARLADDDFLFFEGKQDELLGQIQKRKGEDL